MKLPISILKMFKKCEKDYALAHGSFAHFNYKNKTLAEYKKNKNTNSTSLYEQCKKRCQENRQKIQQLRNRYVL